MDGDPPTLTVTQFDNADPAVSMDAVTSLVHAFAEMVRTSTGALSAQISANAEAGQQRWAVFEPTLERWKEATEARLVLLEGSVHEHHKAAEQAQIARDARVKPVLSTVQWLVANWPKALAVMFAIMFSILGFLAILSDLAARYLGGAS